MKLTYFVACSFVFPSLAFADQMYRPPAPPSPSKKDPRVEEYFRAERATARAVAAEAALQRQSTVLQATMAQMQAAQAEQNQQAAAAKAAQVQAAQEARERARAQAQAAQANQILNSPAVQGTLQALEKAKGDIATAAAIQAEQQLAAERARLLKMGIVHKIDAGLWLGSGPRLFGFGPGAVTEFGVGATFIQSNWRGWFKIGGRWSYGGFSAPDGVAICDPKTLAMPTERCMRPDDRGAVDWGTNPMMFIASAGGEYNLMATLRFRLGLNLTVDKTAYTPQGSVSTTQDNLIGVGLLASVQLTRSTPFPVGLQIVANKADYITPYGDKHSGVNGYLTVVADFDFLNNLMGVQAAQPQ